MGFRNISAWAIRNPIPPLVLFAMLTLAGLLAFNRMDVNNNPDIDFPAANVMPLVSSQKKSDELKTVLDAVSAKLTTEALIEMNSAVSGNAGVDPDEAARKWVQDNGFDKPVSG